MYLAGISLTVSKQVIFRHLSDVGSAVNIWDGQSQLRTKIIYQM